MAHELPSVQRLRASAWLRRVVGLVTGLPKANSVMSGPRRGPVPQGATFGRTAESESRRPGPDFALPQNARRNISPRIGAGVFAHFICGRSKGVRLASPVLYSHP